MVLVLVLGAGVEGLAKLEGFVEVGVDYLVMEWK